MPDRNSQVQDPGSESPAAKSQIRDLRSEIKIAPHASENGPETDSILSPMKTTPTPSFSATVTRRVFLQKAAAAGAVLGFPAPIHGAAAEGSDPPSVGRGQMPFHQP